MAHTRFRLCLAIPVLIVSCRPANEPTGRAALTAARGGEAAQADRMPHCPSVVPGATTVVSEVPDGVALRITASGDGPQAAGGVEEIRKRANYLSTHADETRGKHRSNGGGGGQFGRCPVVMRNTRLEVREIPGGATIVVRPSDPAELAWLRRESEQRSAQLSSPQPFGKGLMATCPNAVANAETRVADAPHGVEMSITGSTEDEVRQIKERAKMFAARGAPGETRCAAAAPSSMVFVDEMPNGVRLTIKAKNPRDVPAIRETVRERLQSYAPPVIR